MNITEQILNPSQGSSITDQVLNAGSERSPLQEALYGNEVSPTEAPLIEETNSVVYLTPEKSQEATEMSKHINGVNGPEIYTEEDLQDADEFESLKMLEENDIKTINKTLQQTVSEGVQKAAIDRAAAISAWDRFLAARFNYDGGLRASDLRQHQAEALANNDFEDTDVSDMQLYQSKIDIVNKIKGELRDQIYKRGYFKDFFAKYWTALKNAMPGYDAAFRADMVSKGLFSATPSQNMRDLHRMWHDALTDSKLTAVQFEALLRASISSFDIPGTTNEELLEYVDNMFDMATAVATTALTADVAVLTKPVIETIEQTSKSGIKAGAKRLARVAAPYLKANEVTPILSKGESPIKTSKDIPDNLTDVVERKKFVGDVKGAADTSVSRVRGIKDTKGMKELLGEADITNAYNKDTKTVKTVMEDIMGEMTKPTGSAVSDISAEAPILTEKAYRRLLINTKQNYETIKNLMSVSSLEEALKNMDNAFESSIEHLLYQTPKDLITKKKVGDLLKAIPADEMRLDSKGEIVARIRHPKEYKSLESAKLGVDSLNHTYAQSIEVVPLTDGKFALEYDFYTHKGFGQLLMETGKIDETWAKEIKSAVATITSAPTPIRQLDFVRSMEADFVERMEKDTKKILKGLSEGEREDVELIEKVMQETPGQYSPDLLKAKGFSDKVVDATMRLRQMRDMEFLIKNFNDRTNMIRDGLKTITVNGRDLGRGVLVYAGDPNKAAEEIKSTKKALIIGHVDAMPIKATDMPEVNTEGLLDAASATNKTTKRLARKLRKEATKNQKEATATAIKDGALNDVYEKVRKGEYVVVASVVSTDGLTNASDLYYVLPKNSVVASELPMFVNNYVPGWNKYYDPKALFVKQGRLDSTGKAVGVTTFFASTDYKQLEKTAWKVEALRKYVAENRPDRLLYGVQVPPTSKELEQIKKYREGFGSLLEKLDIPFAPFKDEDEFVKWAAQVRMDITNVDNPLQILKSEHVPSVVLKGSVIDDITPMDSNTISHYRQRGPIDAIQVDWMNRQQHRYGGSIMNYDFSEATTIDVEDTLQHFVNDMLNNGVMARYNEVYANAFGSKFRDLLIEKYTDFRNWTNEDILLYGLDRIQKIYKSEKVPSHRDQLSRAITAIKNNAMVRGVTSEWDQKISDIGTTILEGIGATADALHIPQAMKNGVSAPFTYIASKEPLKFAQSIAAHRFLGCLNPVQFIKNFLGPASLIVSAEPGHGGAAFLDVFSMVHRLQKQDKNLAKAITKLDAALGIDSKKADMLMRNLLLLDTHTAGVKGGLLTEAVKSENSLSKASLFFFNRADVANRVMAYDTALRKFGFDSKPLTNALDIGRVGAYGDALYINMSKRGLSRLQATETTKLFTQFMGYMFKYVETLCCDKMLTGKQRLSMATMTLLTAGGMGALGTGFYHAISSRTGMDIEEDDAIATRVFKEIAASGAIDTIIKEMGGDISVSGIFGPNVLDSLDTVMNKGMWDIFKGLPAVSTITDYATAMGELARFTWLKYGEDNSYLRWSHLLDLLIAKRETVSSIEKASIAWKMYNTGRKYSSSGQLTSGDNSKLAAVFTLLGGGSQKDREIYLSQMRRQEHKDYYQETLKDALKYARMGYAGNPLGAPLANYTIWEDDNLSFQEKVEAQKALNTDGIIQTGVPLDFREEIQSIKSKTKTGESTYKY